MSCVLLDDLNLGGARECSDERPVLGSDHAQVALGTVGALLGRLKLALEPADSGDALLGHALLQRKIVRRKLCGLRWPKSSNHVAYWDKTLSKEVITFYPDELT